MVRLDVVALCCLAASVSAARSLSPFGVTLPPRGGAGAVSDFAGLCEAVKSSIVERTGQSVSLESFIWVHTSDRLGFIFISRSMCTFKPNSTSC
mmetsp:Transcript_4923/g.9560  ORF Transcript_4923/g.9560 Transcript_4923/m.9560 type:complete len:94 (+) Transcript_4923:494-775(+)